MSEDNNLKSLPERVNEIFASVDDASGESYERLQADLLSVSSKKIIPLLIDQLSEGSHARRLLALQVLLALDAHRESLAEKIPSLLTDKNEDIRVAAIKLARKNIRNESELCRLLSRALDFDDSTRVKKEALRGLAEQNYSLLETSAVKALSNNDHDLRIEALKILSRAGSPRCITAILRQFSTEDTELKRQAEETLDAIYPKLTDSAMVLISEGLTNREKRLFLNHVESRNLQGVYVKLFNHLMGYEPEENNSTSDLNKYGRICNYVKDRPFLGHCYKREETVDSIMRHLLHGNTQSILLMGDSGSGKTAVIHEVIRRLIEHSDAAESWTEQWTVVETSTTELITETRYLGEWETKLKKMVEAIDNLSGNCLLYVTNINGFTGAGTHSGSDENFCDYFRPVLMRGQVTMICESTEDDYRNGIARDSGFARLFKQIKIHPFSEEETCGVIREIIEKNTLRATIGDIDCKGLDDCRFVRTQPTIQRLFKYEATDTEIRTLVDYAKSFDMDHCLPGGAVDLLESIGEHDRATFMEKAYKEKNSSGKSGVSYKATIELTAEKVTSTISQNSGIPLTIIDPSKKFDIEATRKWFSERLIGQDEAIDELMNRLALMKTKLTSPNRPYAVYFLVGPTGVGKTYFAKLVAEYLFGDPKRMNRIDLSEYQGYNALDRLIGSPHSNNRRFSSHGSLTKKIQEQPFCVFLLDEFEKATPDIFSLFLQVFDEARVTDPHGKTLNFSQSVILVTSNVGTSRAHVTNVGFGEQSNTTEGRRKRTLDNMKKFFAPEFLNRLDKVIVFDPLDEKAIEQLIDHEMRKIHDRPGIREHNLKIELDEEARKWIEDNGFSDSYGARHLLRTIEQSVLTSVSILLVQTGEIEKSRRVIVRCRTVDGSDKKELYAEWLPIVGKDKDKAEGDMAEKLSRSKDLSEGSSATDSNTPIPF